MDVVKFIDCVRRRDCIYNKTSADYRQRDIVFDSWRSIAREMNVTVIECKEKWHNLRSNYMRERKKVLGFGIKKWHLLDKLSFLEPHHCARNGQKRRSRRQSAVNCHDDFMDIEEYQASTVPNIASIDRFNFEDAHDLKSIQEDSRHISELAKSNASSLEQSIKDKADKIEKYENVDKSDRVDTQQNVEIPSAKRMQNKFKRRRRTIKRDKCDGIDYEYLKQVRKLTRHLNDSTEDSDRMFLLSLLPLVKQLEPKDNLSFRVQVQQILEHKLTK